MECRNCNKLIADSAAFCPYCGAPTGGERAKNASTGDARNGDAERDGVRTGDVSMGDMSTDGILAGNVQPGGTQMGSKSSEGMGLDGCCSSASVSRHHRLSPPFALIIGGAVIVFVALLFIFSTCSRSFSGGGLASAPSLPTPFEGRVRLRPEGSVRLDFTVLDGESSLSLEGTDGNGARITARLDLIDTDSGSGVYRYDLEELTRGGTSCSIEDIFFPQGVPSDSGSVVDAYIEAISNAQAQIIIPANAVDGDITGVWGIRYTEGGLPYPGIAPKDAGFIFTEIRMSINDDGTFTLAGTMEAVGDDAANLEASLVDLAVTGTWQNSNGGNVSFTPETLRATADGVPEEEISLIGVVPQIYAGVDTADVLRGIDGASGVDGSDNTAVENAGGETSDSNGVNVSSISSWAFMETARVELGVPQYIDYTFEVGEPYYWEGTGMMVTPVTFYLDGYVIASADCDEDGTPVKNMLPYTGGHY